MKRKPRASHIPDFRAARRRIEEVAYDALLEGVEDYAQEQRDAFVEKIDEQAFASFQAILYPESGTNLSPGWLRRKAQKRADLRTMIATGWYRDNIEVLRKLASNRRRDKTVFKVGFRSNVKPRDLDGNTVEVAIPALGLTGLDAIAMVHEKGSIKASIPARPHWRPHYDKMRSEAPRVRRRLRVHVKEALKENLGRRVVVR